MERQDLGVDLTLPNIRDDDSQWHPCRDSPRWTVAVSPRVSGNLGIKDVAGGIRYATADSVIALGILVAPPPPIAGPVSAGSVGEGHRLTGVYVDAFAVGGETIAAYYVTVIGIRIKRRRPGIPGVVDVVDPRAVRRGVCGPVDPNEIKEILSRYGVLPEDVRILKDRKGDVEAVGHLNVQRGEEVASGAKKTRARQVVECYRIGIRGARAHEIA